MIERFGSLPGIGKKTAERLAMHILKVDAQDAMALAQAVKDVKTKIRQCSVCYNLSEAEVCDICADVKRDKSVICVVEQARDVITLEKTGMCKWVYHVLGGHIAPLDGVEPSNLTIDQLIKRIRTEGVKEIVMATNPNVEGDGTSLYICSLLRGADVKVTRLARGLPTGMELEYASSAIIAEAIMARQKIE